MPKVLTITPKDGESPEDFAARASDQVNQFFGSDDTGQTTADASVDTGTGDGGDGYDSTDVSAETEDSGDQADSGS